MPFFLSCNSFYNCYRKAACCLVKFAGDDAILDPFFFVLIGLGLVVPNNRLKFLCIDICPFHTRTVMETCDYEMIDLQVYPNRSSSELIWSPN